MSINPIIFYPDMKETFKNEEKRCSKTLEVLQSEYGVACIEQGLTHIRTTRVTSCLVLCGANRARSKGFLIHLDWCWNLRNLPEVVNAIAKEFQGDEVDAC